MVEVILLRHFGKKRPLMKSNDTSKGWTILNEVETFLKFPAKTSQFEGKKLERKIFMRKFGFQVKMTQTDSK